jgi:phasin family protein
VDKRVTRRNSNLVISMSRQDCKAAKQGPAQLDDHADGLRTLREYYGLGGLGYRPLLGWHFSPYIWHFVQKIPLTQAPGEAFLHGPSSLTLSMNPQAPSSALRTRYECSRSPRSEESATILSINSGSAAAASHSQSVEVPPRDRSQHHKEQSIMEKHTLPLMDITKLVEQFKLPGVDVSALMEARRKDIEALTEVNKIAFESTQTMAQKQVEILQKTMQELSQTMTTGKPLENASKQGEVVQHAMEKAFAYMLELADVARKAQTEALEVISKRAQQNMQELSSLVQSKK